MCDEGQSPGTRIAGQLRALRQRSTHHPIFCRDELVILVLYQVHRDPRGDGVKNGQPSDRDVLLQAKTDPEAFAILYERYVDRIYAYFYYRTGSQEDAEELTARFFHRLFERLHLFEDRGLPVSAWLYRIAHNMLANWRRDNARHPVVSLDVVRPQEGERVRPEDVVLAMEEQEMVLQLVRQLPPERQQLLYLKFVEGLPNAEISRIMGRTEGAIKSLYHRTLTSLRRQLQKKGL